MHEQQLICELVEVRVKRYLFKHKQRSQAEVWNSCGLGVTPQQFEIIIEKLEEQGLIKSTCGNRKSLILNWVDEQPIG